MRHRVQAQLLHLGWRKAVGGWLAASWRRQRAMQGEQGAEGQRVADACIVCMRLLLG